MLKNYALLTIYLIMVPHSTGLPFKYSSNSNGPQIQNNLTKSTLLYSGIPLERAVYVIIIRVQSF